MSFSCLLMVSVDIVIFFVCGVKVFVGQGFNDNIECLEFFILLFTTSFERIFKNYSEIVSFQKVLIL